MLKNNEPWSIDFILCDTSPFEYDQGDMCTVYYDDLYNLKAALSAAKKDIRDLNTDNDWHKTRLSESIKRAESAESSLARYRTAAETVAHCLKISEVLGAEKDEPEGSRYIQISETLVKRLLAALSAKGE